MPTAQKRNDSMQQLNSVDQLRVQDRNFAAEWYDSAGGQVLTGGSPQTLNLNVERLNTAPTVYVLASDIVTITEAGIYAFDFRTTIGHSSGTTDSVATAYLEQDPDTGVFAVVTATQTWFAMHSVGRASGQVSTLLRVGFDYRYKITVALANGSDPLVTTANGSSLRIMRLWQNG